MIRFRDRAAAAASLRDPGVRPYKIPNGSYRLVSLGYAATGDRHEHHAHRHALPAPPPPHGPRRPGRHAPARFRWIPAARRRRIPPPYARAGRPLPHRAPGAPPAHRLRRAPARRAERGAARPLDARPHRRRRVRAARPARPRDPLRSLGPRPVLRRCSVQVHSPQAVVEAFATIATGARVRAMAFRLERGEDQRWRCAAVELDGLGLAPRHA
ncbi:Rv3235 family protein [Streptomyces litmocidini]|uniref:Rv3235 family protein n=1 Tax=Streptomyces litmocidini TaxID=67318 RepID=A0ABW7UJH3_9ACTN